MSDMLHRGSAELVVVTGASRGLGRELALQTAATGVLMVLAARDRDALRSVGGECKKRGADVRVCPADLTTEGGVGVVVSAFRSASGPRLARALLFNNASVIDPIGRLAHTDADGQRRLIDVNVTASLRIASEFVKFCEEAEPAESYVVNISSGVSLKPIVGWGLYCVSKAAVNMLSACIAEETAGWGQPVYSVAVNPGALDTEMQRAIRDSDPDEAPIGNRFRRMHAEGGLRSPKDGATRVLELLSRRPFPQGEFVDLNVLT